MDDYNQLIRCELRKMRWFGKPATSDINRRGEDPVPTQADLFLRFLHASRTMQIVAMSFGHARSDR
ncbi:hypothetical protein BEL01nite_69160 [Bradyrhizobium elkanii]|nr:hypothetical protein BEL01nite_69160 [Bradyrhizobium elkanii]